MLSKSAPHHSPQSAAAIGGASPTESRAAPLRHWLDRHFWAALGLFMAAAAIATRWPVRISYFQVDDFIWLHLAHWRSVAASFFGSFGGAPGGLIAYRPIFRVSVYIDDLLFGQNPIWWHFENVLIHAANAWLVARVVSGFRLPRSVCAVAGLLFLVAPYNSESVDWISGRTASLSFLFMLLSAWRWTLAVGEHRAPWGAVIWMLVAAGTYEGAVALPFVLLSLVPLIAKTTDVDWRYAARQTVLPIACLAAFLVFRGFALGTPFGHAAPTNLNLLSNTSDHFRLLWEVNLRTASDLLRWVMLAALILTSFHPRLFPAGPCLLAAANILLLPFITTPGAGSRFFYTLQAPLCVMAVLPVLLIAKRYRPAALALFALALLPGLVVSSWHETEAVAKAGYNTKALFKAVHRAIPKNRGYINVVDGVPYETDGRMMAGAFFEQGIGETYHDPTLPPPFIARSETMLAAPVLLRAMFTAPSLFWRYDADKAEMVSITREAWLAAHPEANRENPAAPANP